MPSQTDIGYSYFFSFLLFFFFARVNQIPFQSEWVIWSFLPICTKIIGFYFCRMKKENSPGTKWWKYWARTNSLQSQGCVQIEHLEFVSSVENVVSCTKVHPACALWPSCCFNFADKYLWHFRRWFFLLLFLALFGGLRLVFSSTTLF